MEFIETPDQNETDFTKSLRQAKLLIEKKHLQVIFIQNLDVYNIGG